MDVSQLEPADRDPKAIRRTVITLILTMIIGGVVIWVKYNAQQERDREEQVEGRSPRINRLNRNFAGVCQDGNVRGLHDLEGKVWVVAPIVPNQPHENAIQLQKMQELSKTFGERDDFHLVCISVADPQEFGYEALATLAKEQNADINKWWFMAAERDSAIGFLKDHLKMAHINERKGEEAEKLGVYDVPAMLRVVDQSRRVRGEHQQFDFDFAHYKTEETQQAIKDNPALMADDVDPEVADVRDFYLHMDARWTERMHKVINYSFNETETDSDPDYITAIVVTLAILGAIFIQILRLRRKAKL
ncbi:hypothetical protein [Rubritalea marina]|uniref:hypothetical protein n=1 Tax=Rubritalea marina TaxID=361055 RepID=UPI00035D2EF5|nr:hypothetical protein [Rubritalea marina]